MQKPIGQGHSSGHIQWGIDPKLDRRLLDREHNMKIKPIAAAFGWPGMEPRWTRGGKDGVGTAYAAFLSKANIGRRIVQLKTKEPFFSQ
jgi:hypothetical protein